MLTELFIRNFAIIDEVRLAFSAGFNVMTGETGAGKSIILDAVMLVLGDRADKAMVRAGCDRATIEATFTLSETIQALLNPLLEQEGLDGETPDILIVEREVRTSGRSLGRINGRSVALTLLQQVGERLVDIHGQGTHLSLLKPKAHLPLLDSYAHLNAARSHVADEVAAWREIERELAYLRRDERMLAQRVDMLTYQVQEIDDAELLPGEDDELLSERKRLANAEQLSRYAAEVVAAIVGLDDDMPSVVDMLSEAERSLANLTRLDDEQAPLLETLQGLLYQINDLGAQVADYQETLEFNPERLNVVEERIELINRLKRKYGESVEAILAYRDTAATELDGISNSEERIKKLSAESDKRLHTIGKLSAALSAARKAAAGKLAEMVEQELGHLRMQARFDVAFAVTPDPNGAYVDGERLAFDQSGIDSAEFLISTNPGEPLKPMAKVASGGETARLMLALKTALAQVDETPTLIFDEIDQGIGGRIGETVGRKLWGLAAHSHHQVIVVTHLPQLAGYGDAHFHVSKRVDDGRTRTHVANLDYAERVDELAAMLGTADQHARGGATSILEQAAAAKT